MTYELTNSTTVLRTSDNTFIPKDPENLDYQEFLKWCQEGNTPEPFKEATCVDRETDLSKGKEIAANEVKFRAYLLLEPTDWVVVRKAETGTEAPEDIAAFRAAVRAASAEKFSEIDAQTSLEELKDYLRSNEYAFWPTPAKV